MEEKVYRAAFIFVLRKFQEVEEYLEDYDTGSRRHQVCSMLSREIDDYIEEKGIKL